jgi:hypothetical protein
MNGGGKRNKKIIGRSGGENVTMETIRVFVWRVLSEGVADGET